MSKSVDVNISEIRYTTLGLLLFFAMLFGTLAHCHVQTAEVRNKCLDAGHDPAACNDMKLG